MKGFEDRISLRLLLRGLQMHLPFLERRRRRRRRRGRHPLPLSITAVSTFGVGSNRTSCGIAFLSKNRPYEFKNEHHHSFRNVFPDFSKQRPPIPYVRMIFLNIVQSSWPVSENYKLSLGRNVSRRASSSLFRESSRPSREVSEEMIRGQGIPQIWEILSIITAVIKFLCPVSFRSWTMARRVRSNENHEGENGWELLVNLITPYRVSPNS